MNLSKAPVPSDQVFLAKTERYAICVPLRLGSAHLVLSFTPDLEHAKDLCEQIKPIGTQQAKVIPHPNFNFTDPGRYLFIELPDVFLDHYTTGLLPRVVLTGNTRTSIGKDHPIELYAQDVYIWDLAQKVIVSF